MIRSKIFNAGVLLAGIFLGSVVACNKETPVSTISTAEQLYIIETATAYLDSLPVTVTAAICERSAGGPH
ncbi:MAG TPA: hypothetical protein P5210_13010, partial [Draconibacterium sp.]|nr:hypothetical protein [Draconibacterium sp.]